MIGISARTATIFVECQVPPTVLAQRAKRRAVDPQSVSDADLTVVMRESGGWQPLDEVPADAHLPLRTDRPLDHILADVIALLDARLMELLPPVNGARA